MIFLGKSKQSEFYKVLESKEELDSLMADRKHFFKFDNDIQEIDFIKNPIYKLNKKTIKDDSTKDEWFFIDYSENTDIEKIVRGYKGVFKSSSDFSNLTTTNINKINFLINARKTKGKYSINFQVIRNASYIRARQFLKIGSNKAKYKTEENILNFTDNIDIHISESSKKIYFKKFAHIKQINEVFIDLYRESTKEEIDVFKDKVSKCKMFLMKDFTIQENNSKSIKFILDNNKADFSTNKEKVNKYIDKYPTGLNKNNEMYEINNNRDLTNLIKVIDERYYEGEITGNHMESNSSKIVK